MYKCHQIGKSQVTDYVHVFFSLSPHNTKYTGPKESVIFIDEKIKKRTLFYMYGHLHACFKNTLKYQ